MADVFSEVDDRVRDARRREAWSRGWPYLAGLAMIVLVAGLGFWAWTEHVKSQEEQASVAYAGALDALRSDPTRASAGFAQAAQDAPPAYRALSLMQQAGLSLKAGHAPEATRRLDEAVRAAPDRVLADAAALEAAYVVMDSGALSDATSRLQPLAETGRPYRAMAREALAFAELAAGRFAAARSDLTLVTLGSDVSEPARARARAALAMIQSGSAAALGPIVKAQQALPPLPATPAARQGGAS